MSDSPMYEHMRAFIRTAVELEVTKALPELRASLTGEIPKVVEGPPGPKGDPGERGADSTVPGPKGDPGERGERGAVGDLGPQGERGAEGLQGREGLAGKDGALGEKGERGADGIASREELESLIEVRFADLQVRTFADAYQGVYQADRDYTRGMLTTWGGSLFLALADTRARPEMNGDWKLIVKRGADGRK